MSGDDAKDKRRPLGRPTLSEEERRSGMLRVRWTPAEEALWREAAEAAGEKLSEFVRAAVNQRARKVLKR